MEEIKDDVVNLPPAPARVFMVDIGGIGMSGLAQLLRWEGYEVAGSDRGLDEPGKAELYEDDGISLDYRTGVGAFTRCEQKGGVLTIGPRRGSFKGMPDVHAWKVVFHKEGTNETTTVDLGEVKASTGASVKR